ncbi:MAG: hypothetical protein M1114_06095 [Candidatus Dependentiae bacterium]|nr:hypothetical protein [Candidatus Dependentiae bacterium]
MKKSKSIKHGLPKELKEEWRRMYDRSNHNNVSRGAEDLHKTRPAPHGEEWRGRENKHRKAK